MVKLHSSRLGHGWERKKPQERNWICVNSGKISKSRIDNAQQNSKSMLSGYKDETVDYITNSKPVQD